MYFSLKLLFQVIVFVWGVYVVNSWVCLLRNYRTARKVGLPLRVIPVSPENPLWMLVDKKIFVPLFAYFPIGTGSFTRFNWRGWEFADKYQVHEELGDIFMMVTPGRLWVHLCNPEALSEVLRKEKDFPRPLEIFEMTKVFGDNVSTADGKAWNKHRKITSLAFNEHNNEFLWTESLRQSQDMGRYWSSKNCITTTADDTRTLSLHILSAAGFGKFYQFQGQEEKSPTSAATNYKESLQIILDNCLYLFVLGTNIIKKPWMPKKLRLLNDAVITFQNYMTDVYEAEKRDTAQSKAANNNLMTQLIRASLGEDGLSESEIYGNIFVFNFAGHDTTAHTFAFTVYLLATNPIVQEWVSEELQHVLGDRPVETWSYSHEFPRLKRCLALLYETLRLYPPVPIAKSTGKGDRTLVVEGKVLVLPPNTLVIPNHVATHTHPKFWGSDSLDYKPSRWIESSGTSPENETFVTPRKGSFIPWSEGIRNCPGKKFSQVEFVATLAVLLRHWRVEPKLQLNETMDQARRRVLQLVEKDTGQVLLLQMLHPERAPLVWKHVKV
ncbi:putative cytochrome P450 [Pyrenochaeta sp. DS3sAY3a]|nr:putative cytochrome P450 [Pyrenochaeta sp. DS3sAY3a]